MARKTASASSWKRTARGCRGALVGQGGAHLRLLLTPCAALLPLTPRGQVNRGDVRGGSASLPGAQPNPQAPAPRCSSGEQCLDPARAPGQSHICWFFHCLVPALPTAREAQGPLPAPDSMAQRLSPDSKRVCSFGPLPAPGSPAAALGLTEVILPVAGGPRALRWQAAHAGLWLSREAAAACPSLLTPAPRFTVQL